MKRKNTLVVLNGPNLNILEKRPVSLYGGAHATEIREKLQSLTDSHDVGLLWQQSNCEGQLIDYLQELLDDPPIGLIINPAAYSHSSLAICDVLELLSCPIIEVHLSNLYARQESERRNSLTASKANSIIMGFGGEGYLIAAATLLGHKKG